MAFDQRELRAFLAVVDAGSLGRAAANVHLSQPALSRLIQQMEQRFGQPLFERHTKGMVPTTAGETLAPHARLLLFEMEQAGEALDALRGLRRGVARIGAVAAVTRSVMPEAAAGLLEAAPDLRIEMLEAPDDKLVDGLAGRAIDLMIAAEPPPHDEIMRIAECRFDDVYAVFCAARQTLALPDILTEKWVMPAPGATPRILFESLIKGAGHGLPVVAVETGSVSAQVAFVARSRLLGWLPRPLLASDLAHGDIRLLPVEALAVRRRFFVYRRRRGLLPAAAREMLKALPLLDAAG